MGRKYKNPVGYFKPPFISYNIHSRESPVMRNENMIITSIDPGIANCGIYVCCYNIKTKKETSLYLGRLEFKGEDSHYTKSISVLNELEEVNKYFSSSHYIIIESQMAISYTNTRMGQHLITYFLTSLKDKGNRPMVIEFNSQSKTRMLGCPKGMKKPEYKKWCRETASKLLIERNSEHENQFLDCLKNQKKADDMGDAICQYKSWILVMNGEGLSIPKPIMRFN